MTKRTKHVLCVPVCERTHLWSDGVCNFFRGQMSFFLVAFDISWWALFLDVALVHVGGCGGLFSFSPLSFLSFSSVSMQILHKNSFVSCYFIFTSNLILTLLIGICFVLEFFMMFFSISSINIMLIGD